MDDQSLDRDLTELRDKKTNFMEFISDSCNTDRQVLRRIAEEMFEGFHAQIIQNHNSTRIAADVAALRSVEISAIKKKETWILSFQGGLLVLWLLHMMGAQINVGSLLTELFKLIVTRTP